MQILVNSADEPVMIVSSQNGSFGQPSKYVLTINGEGTIYIGATPEEATPEDGLPVPAGAYLSDTDLRMDKAIYASAATGIVDVRVIRTGAP